MFLFLQSPIEAHAMNEQSNLVDLVEEWRKNQTDETLESHDQLVAKLLMDDFIADLDRIHQIESYEIEIRWTDLKNNHRLGQVNLVGDKETGNLKGIITYCFNDYYPQVAQAEFETHQRFDLNYVKGLPLLQSLAFFQQPYFDQDYSKSIAEMNIDTISIDGDKLSLGNLSADTLNPLLLMPNISKLRQADSQLLRKNDQSYYLKLESLDVPPLLFEGQQYLNFNYRLNLTLSDEKTAKQAYAPMNIQWNHTLDVSEDANFLSFNVDVSSSLAQSLLKPQANMANDINPTNFNKKMSLSSKGLTEKVTKVEMSLDPQAQVYAILVEGMVENMDLNIFNEDSSKLSTNHLRMEYRIKPQKADRPQWVPLPATRLTADELEYYLEQYWIDQ